MARAKHSGADKFFSSAPTTGEQALSELEKERRARVALTANLREQRLAKEEADRATGTKPKRSRTKVAAGTGRAAKSKQR